jgi:multidrug resistance efflux pump
MTWSSRFKLLAGILVVIVLVAAFTVIFTKRQSQVVSTSASIQAEEYEIGTDYSGSIVKQFVEVGDKVTKGDKLFQIKSLSVLQDVRSDLLSYKSTSYTVTPDGTMTFLATVSGIVSKIDTKEGGFVQSGADLATIDRADSLYVLGDYTLTPRDYERIQDGAIVELMLPNQTTVDGTVKKVSVQTTEGNAETEIEVASKYLVQGAYSGLVNPGTPITATLSLRQDGMFAGAQDAMLAFVQKIGL